jgi:DNA-binding transcriptional LysR family regulator
VTAADFVRYRYVGRGPEWAAEQTVRQMLGEAYDRVDVLNFGHPEYVRAAAIAGLGFAALPKRAVADDIARGVLKRLPVQPVLRSITAIRRSSRGGPAQEAFWSLLTGSQDTVSSKISADGSPAD